ncbi:MAG: hypothetical protein BGO29_10120 [Bacteroidales bacterium 36-12]|nr:MAG: hypothetical protein BGO29_10120 [Bacteroidales bacterium 36-12]
MRKFEFRYLLALMLYVLHLPYLAATTSKLNKSSETTNLHSYSDNSVLSQGRFHKLKITESGVYKLTYSDLTSMGIDPDNVSIFGYGGGVLEQDFSLPMLDDLPEIAIWMEKGSDGIFNDGDYILFYAQGVTRWKYNKNKNMFTHLTNTYSNAGYYFISSDVGIAKRIEKQSIELPTNYPIYDITEFIDFQVHERDLINLVNGGKEFYGETFDNGGNRKFIFDFPNSVLSENSVLANLDVAAASPAPSDFIINLNDSQHKTLTVKALTLYDPYEKAKINSGIFTFTPQNDLFEFNLTYSMPAPTSVGYLNFLEVNLRRHLMMNGSLMPFQNVDYLGQHAANKYILTNDNPNIQVWDITNQQNIYSIITSNTDNQMSFIDSSMELKHYLAIDPTDAAAFRKPEIIGLVSNQNLHAILQADMVIVTHPDFQSQAEILAEAHRQKDNMTVTVATTEQVYNEFSSGTPDATAYRRLMKMFYDRAIASGNSTNLPKHLLLFGRGTFDNRKILADSGDNFVLTYQADNAIYELNTYTTDDYFTFLENHEGMQLYGHSMDIAVGRFPVTNQQQASDVVSKTINYMNNTNKGRWKNNLCFIGDDRDYCVHMKMADDLATEINKDYKSYHTNKILMDAYPKVTASVGESYPAAKDSLLSALDNGLLLFNYSGHAHHQSLSYEQILTNEDVVNLKNNYLPLWIVAACEFVRFDNQIVSAGENVLLNPDGGGIGILSAARLTYATLNYHLNKNLIRSLFDKENENHISIGEAIKNAKNNVWQDFNKLSYIYLGDPAIKLNYADTYQIITDKINDNISFENDTLKANTTQTIEGSIVDNNLNLVSEFNGKLYCSIYDKSYTYTTLRNGNFANEPAYEYIDRPLILHSEEIDVVDGKFAYTFTLPIDIDEEFGNGKMIFYAYDDINVTEAQGYLEDFIIGGIDNKAGVFQPHTNASTSDLMLLCYPNPAKDYVYFSISNSDDIISYDIDIFDISGRLIRNLSSNGDDKMRWDITTNNGEKVNAGVYIYKAKIRTTDKTIKTESNRIIITD